VDPLEPGREVARLGGREPADIQPFALTMERVAELAARARDQDAASVSRGERIGDR
jgi:hypothetical protein